MADGLFGSGGAAFGVYPQMGGRRRIQDTQGSADVPIQTLIGRLAGLLGAPAEVGNIVRSPQPMEMYGDVNYDPQTQLPYDTKYFNQRLPLQPTSRVGELARDAGSFVPLNPMPAVRAGQGIARMAGQEITDVMSGLPARSVLGEMTPSPMQLIGTRFKTGTPTEVPGFGAAKEIPDNYSFFSGEALKDLSQVFGNKNVTLKDILAHPSLYRDYPELAKYPVTGLGLFQNNLKGAYGEGKLYLQRNFKPTTDDIKAAHSTLLHEVQHAIQELDKMPMGGMTEDFLSVGYKKAAGKIGLMRDGAMKELKSLIKDKGYESSAYYDILFNNKKGQELLTKDKDINIVAELNNRLQKSQMKLEDKYNQAFEKYKRYAGETQARAVQQRFLNPQEYRKPVLESYDRPVELLIYRDPFGNTAQ